MGPLPRHALCILFCAAGVGVLSNPQRLTETTDETDQSLLTPPGLVVALRHNLHHEEL